MDHALDAKSAFGAVKKPVNATKQERPKARKRMARRQSFAIDVPSTSTRAIKGKRPLPVDLQSRS